MVQPPIMFFWMSDAAMNTTAGRAVTSVKIKGNFVSKAGGISLGVYTDLEGRMRTKFGAIAAGANCILTVPAGASPIDLGVFSLLVIFTSAGAASAGAGSTTIGDVSSGLGVIAIAGTHTGGIYPAGTNATVVPVNSTT
jgi:hypothetical protein